MPGRPKGSKNRPKEVIEAEREAKAQQPKRGKGRPPGSKNKPKTGPRRVFNVTERQALVAAQMIEHKEELAERAKENKYSAANIRRILGMADPGDNANVISHMMNTAFLPPIDTSNPDEVRARITDYARMCIENDMKMTVEGTALALGISRNTFREVANGTRKRPRELQEVYAWAYNIVQNVATQSMIEGKAPPVASIFIMRNNFGYTNIDNPDTDSGATSAGQSTEEIVEKYKNLPE